ncbi:DUF6193 family natural product biosynthesis protein [Streptomyces sp. NPDC019443]|uniref:DUF6193 family natural product biosynthesis protein n=1 Tax=Streptomyces sp. NPDC019443 TaxID=3365061 RepID=UPI00379688CE
MKWRLLLDDLRHEAERLGHAQSILKVAEAAHAESTLRQLYPFASSAIRRRRHGRVDGPLLSVLASARRRRRSGKALVGRRPGS